MNHTEIKQRLRIGLALFIGYLTGKGLEIFLGQHPSESFVLGSLLGVLGTQGSFWCYDRWVQKTSKTPDPKRTS
jgi:hypothetical protein